MFFAAIIIDFITGILLAAKNGRLKSRLCRDGLFRSLGECILLTMFVFVATYIPGYDLLFSTFIIGFTFKETLSIVENLVGLDVWIPESIKRMLSVYVDRVDNIDNIDDFDDKIS